ncbi:AAA family ATPase [Clostridium hydrogeniformans]|uniref:AAA family ATPase n=1 Tax=Clostridium hydrogeniformans TaxID=349933 RepID=UPI0004870912|nr:AAA family ATPase [Clostridium hydrogeniformans]
MRIYIVGSVASGKTTLAKELSNKLGIKCTHLDGIVHIKDKTNKEWGNIRRTDEEINRLFKSTIMESHWVIEDAGRKIFSEGMEEADVIVHLKPSIFVRRMRVIIRFFKQKLGMEECLYTPSIHMLKFMFKALNNYEIGKDDLETRLNQYTNKAVILSRGKESKKFIESVLLSEYGMKDDEKLN